jgi:hypothetical protein
MALIDNELPGQVKDEEKLSGYTYEGKEIALIKKLGPPYRIKNPEYFKMEQKIDACTLYCVYGDLEQVSNMTGIPVKFIRDWKEEPWWFEVQKKVYTEQNDKLASQINVVLDKSIDHLKDRLEHGDYLWDVRNSQLVRKPVDTKVLSQVFNNLIHRRQLIRGEPTSITAAVGVDERLTKLADEFKRFAAAKEITNAPQERIIEEGSVGEH